MEKPQLRANRAASGFRPETHIGLIKNPKFLASAIISEVAPELGLEVLIEPKFGYVGQIKSPDGRIFYFRNTSFDLNGQGSADNAKDKGYAAYFMRLMGYPVPEDKTFYSDRFAKIIKSDQDLDAARQYAKVLGYPVIVKPNSKSQGMGVEKVYHDDELSIAMKYIFNEIKDRVAVVQQFVEGDDYRIVTLDNEVIAAYRRLPLSVVGDGIHSIMQLLQIKQETFNAIGRDTVIKLDDPKVHRRLQRLDLKYEDVPSKNESIRLLDNANLSTGGDAIDVTDIIHPSYKEMAVKLAHDMGLRYSGVDIITKVPVEEPVSNYSVIEINAAPGLDYYVNIGQKQQKAVREMYKKVLIAMIKQK